MFCAPHSLTILFATETGTAAAYAEWAVSEAAKLALPARALDMATYNTSRLAGERNLLVIASTHGEGEPPTTAEDFFEFLDEVRADLSGSCFAVLALGDSGYDEFCAAGKRIDRQLEVLGATRLAPRRDGDVGERREDREWLGEVISAFARQASEMPRR